MPSVPSILILDDDPTVVLLYRAMLGRLGLVVKTATDGFDALKLLERTTFDLVITDLRMPRMSGLEFLTELRNRGFRSEVLVVSGYPGSVSPGDLAKVGVRSFLRKPILLDDLRRAVGGALGMELEYTTQAEA